MLNSQEGMKTSSKLHVSEGTVLAYWSHEAMRPEPIVLKEHLRGRTNGTNRAGSLTAGNCASLPTVVMDRCLCVSLDLPGLHCL